MIDSCQDWNNEPRVPDSLQTTLELISLGSSSYLSETCLLCGSSLRVCQSISCSFARLNCQNHLSELFMLVSNQPAIAARAPSNRTHAWLLWWLTFSPGPGRAYRRWVWGIGVGWCLWLMGQRLELGTCPSDCIFLGCFCPTSVHHCSMTTGYWWKMVPWCWEWGSWLGVLMTQGPTGHEHILILNSGWVCSISRGSWVSVMQHDHSFVISEVWLYDVPVFGSGSNTGTSIGAP